MRGRIHAPTYDHINPKSRGGGPTLKCCARCNVFKAGRPVLAWLMWLEINRPSRLPAVIRLYEERRVIWHVSEAERPALVEWFTRQLVR